MVKNIIQKISKRGNSRHLNEGYIANIEINARKTIRNVNEMRMKKKINYHHN